jgi:potassium efflux system protein
VGEELNPSQAIESLRSELNDRISRIETDDEATAELKVSALQLYQEKALPILNQALEATSNATVLAEQARQAPELIDQAEAQLRGPAFPLPALDNRPLDALQSMLTLAMEKKAKTQGELTPLDDRIKVLRGRPNLLAGELAEARLKLEEIRAELQKAAAPDEPPILATARKDVLRARQSRRSEQIRALLLERAGLDPQTRLIQVQRELAARRLNELQAEEDALNAEISKRRADAAAQARLDDAAALQQAKKADEHPLIVQLAETNAALSAELQQVELDRLEVSRQREELESRATALHDQYESSKHLLELLGTAGEAGHELRTRRKRLPRYHREWSRDVAEREGRIRAARLRSWELEQETDRLSNRSQTVLDQLPESLRPDGQRLLDGQANRVRSLSDAWDRYRKELVGLNADEEANVTEITEYRKFLDAHLLWTRSAAPVGPATGTALLTSIQALLNPGPWRQAGAQLAAQATDHPGQVALVLIAVVCMFAVRRRLRGRIRELAKLVSRMTTDRYLYTPEVILWTAVLAVPAALVFAFPGWLLVRVRVAPDEVRAIGMGLASVGGLLFLIDFLRGILREDGVARVHFHWPADGVAQVRRHLRWFQWATPLPIFILIWSVWLDVEAVRSGFGLLSFLILMALLSLLLDRFLRGKAGTLIWVKETTRGRWSWKVLEGLLRSVSPLPVVFGGIALLGFHYTAFQLSKRLTASLILFAGLAILYAAVRRMLALAAMRLEVNRLRSQRAAEFESAGKRDQTGGFPVAPETSMVGVNEINLQTRRVVQALMFLIAAAGLVGIWAPTLPALTLLDNVVFWRVTVPGSTDTRTITLGSLLYSLVVVVITLGAARNLPGLLEILILEPLKLDAGTRYATTTIVRYLITGIGFVVAFENLGLGWSQVQWLVAALGVGLGFGLQEIFANFVSGLIILFERPIRVSDIVTVGDVTGVVSRIRIRATTITNWDRKEYIVPNKEFVTGRVLNWTLTDKVNRIVIPVGIAYGSDTEKARQLLFQICREHPLIMKDPKTLVTFEGFGDSTLNFVVRAYLPDLDNRLEVTHQLYTKIHDVFAREGIEIAFPQRDLHIRTAPPDSPPPTQPEGRPNGSIG